MSEMKNSGVKWIGEIPINWDVNKIKFITKIPITDGPHETPVFVDEGVPFYSVDGIKNEHIFYEHCRYISTEDADRYDRKVIPSYGDILMGKAASVGKIAIIDKKIRMQVWSPLAIIRTNENFVHNKFLKYYLLSDSAQIEIDLKSTTNTQKNIAMEDIENIVLPVPDIKEQQLIALFLDKKVGRIDEILNDLNNQIEILNKYKKSLITEIVTKGINPDVEMKESGIDWIGMIPKSWNICRIKDVCFLARGGSPRPIDEYLSYNDKDINWVKIGDTTKGYKYIDSTEQKIIKSGVLKSRYVNKGDLLLTNSMSFGQPYILNIEGCIHDGWLVFSNYKGIDKLFLYYVLMSEVCYYQFKKSVAGAVVENLNIDKVSVSKIFVPTLDIQKQIVEFLDKKCMEIDGLIENKKIQIEKMKKYKKSLIYEYVTGKKRVKGAEELYG